MRNFSLLIHKKQNKMMNGRERLMTTLRGEKADRVPLTIYDWLIPDKKAGKRLIDKGLITINSKRVFHEEIRGVTVRKKEIGLGINKEFVTTIETPVGSLVERAKLDPTLQSRWVIEHFIKSLDDYRVMKYVFDHTETKPAFEEFREADVRTGLRGIVLGEILPIPIQWLSVELMGTETWSEGVMMYPDEMAELHESLTRLYRQQVSIAADSPAEVIWLPDNITGSIMSPQLFDQYCGPIYAEACVELKQADKLSFSHFDGINRPIAKNIAQTPVDIIEAFTPPPMCDMTVAEACAAWPDKVLSLNVPGILFTEPYEVIESYIKQYMKEGSQRNGFVIGCTEEYDFTKFEHAFSAIGSAMYDES